MVLQWRVEVKVGAEVGGVEDDIDVGFEMM
jgi:hypothetical protein